MSFIWKWAPHMICYIRNLISRLLFVDKSVNSVWHEHYIENNHVHTIYKHCSFTLYMLPVISCDFFYFYYFHTAHTQRLLKLQSMLRSAPSYRTLELQLIEWQERELFEYFVVVSLKKKPTKNSYTPEVTYQFPKVNILCQKEETLCLFDICTTSDAYQCVAKVRYTSVFVLRILLSASFRISSHRAAVKPFPDKALMYNCI